MGKQAEEMTMVRGNDSDDGSFSWKRKIFSACFPGDDDDDDDGDDGDDGVCAQMTIYWRHLACNPIAPGLSR